MKRIKLLVRNNVIIRRLLFLKQLILGKLETLILSVQDLNRHADERFVELQETGNTILANTRTVLENEVFLLKSSVDTVQALTTSLAKTEISEAHLIQLLERSSTAVETSLRSFSELRERLTELSERSRELCQQVTDNQNEIHAKVIANHGLLMGMTKDIKGMKYKFVSDLSGFQSTEIELLSYLYSYVPHRVAIDVGANQGDVASRLLEAGYEVYSFEPFPPIFERLRERLGHISNFHAMPFALGSAEETRNLHLADDLTPDNTYKDPTLYSSLIPHSLSDGLVFKDTIPVSIKTIEGLHLRGELPSEVGIVKIDAEGFDLEVIKGMGDFQYPVVMAEFWDPGCPFGVSGTLNYLRDMVPVMRGKNYFWHLVIYRIWGSDDISFYANSMFSFDGSWGNVLFFQDQVVFLEALKWCFSALPATYFTS